MNMHQCQHSPFWILAVLMCLCTSLTNASDESQADISLTTALNIQDSDPQYAIELYNEVLAVSTDRSDWFISAFNTGVLHLNGDDIENAAESFRAAGIHASSVTERRDSMFNLGHALHQQVDSNGELMMDPEQIEEAITKLRQSEQAFLDAARADPSHIESKKNVARIRKQIKQLSDLKEQIENQQEQENQQSEGEDGEQQDGEQQDGENQQSMSDQLQDLADQQREQAQSSEAADQDQAQQDPQDQEQRSEQQQELNEQTEQASEQSQQSGQDQETMEDLQQAMQAQQEAQKALEQGDNQTAAQKQQEAADALERAAERARESEAQEQSEQQPQQGQSGQPSEEPSDQEPESIDELAQDLLDKERRERERRQAYRDTGRPVKVEEDW